MNLPRRLPFAFALCSALTSLVAQTSVAEPLPCAAGWRAERIHQADGGVWYVQVASVVEQLGQPEVICCDDKGRFVVLTVYSGQWTEHAVTGDGLWLAPSRPADVDARVAGNELYAAGRGGSVFQVTRRDLPFARFVFEANEIGHVAGEEFHAILAADLMPGGAVRDELLTFGVTGAAYQVLQGVDGAMGMRKVAQLPGRVRDVVVLPGEGEVATMVGASRSGHLLRMRLGADGLQHDSVHREDSGLGRVALGREPGVVYATRDDGVLVRYQLGADASLVAREVIYVGGPGLRGVAAGRFFADGREAVAVYGYDKRVHMVTRRDGDGGGWQVETIWQGAQRGHWLTVAELDGRNATDELVASGFDGMVVLLSRPPGEGLPGAAVPDEERAPAEAPRRAPTSGR